MSELLTLRRFLELERRVNRIERTLQMEVFHEPEVPAPIELGSVVQGDDALVVPSPGASASPSVAGVPPIAAVAEAAVTPPLPPPLPEIVRQLNGRKAEARQVVAPVAPVVQYATPVKKEPRKDHGGAPVVERAGRRCGEKLEREQGEGHDAGRD